MDGEGEEGVNMGAEGLSFVFDVQRLRSGADDEGVVVFVSAIVIFVLLLVISGGVEKKSSRRRLLLRVCSAYLNCESTYGQWAYA